MTPSMYGVSIYWHNFASKWYTLKKLALIHDKSSINVGGYDRTKSSSETNFWHQKRWNLRWRHSQSVQKGPPLTSICKWLAFIMPKDYTDSKFGFSFSDFQTAFYLIFKSVPASRDFWTVLCEAFHWGHCPSCNATLLFSWSYKKKWKWQIYALVPGNCCPLSTMKTLDSIDDKVRHMPTRLEPFWWRA